jgi:hypothetical protein
MPLNLPRTVLKKFKPLAVEAVAMWSFQFEDDDSFLPMTFGNEGSASLFGPPEDPLEAPVFNFQTRPNPPERPAATYRASPAAQPDQSALLAENAQLRQTALSLDERFSQCASLNQRLKSQLEECRNTFRNAIFSGFANRS